MAKPPSLADVARIAKLSPAAVSRYLNGSLTLPAATAAQIDAAIAKLNYRPNPHARSLSRGKSDTIGLVIPDIANPFFAQLAAAVERAADAAGLGVMLCSSLNRADRELSYIERLSKNFVDGLLFATNHVDDGAIARAINANTNIVLIDEDVPGTHAAKVFSDNTQGGLFAAQQILAAGHLRLAFIGGPAGLMSCRERADGFRQGVADAGNGARIEAELFGDYTMAHGRSAMEDILAKHPGVTAVFVASDEILLGMLGVLRERQLHVGDYMSIVTFDDAAQLALLEPPITAIRQSINDMGRRALELIQRKPSEANPDTIERIPVELIIRASVVSPRKGE